MEIIIGIVVMFVMLWFIGTFWKFILRFLASYLAITIVLLIPVAIIGGLLGIDLLENELVGNISVNIAMIIGIIIAIIWGMLSDDNSVSNSSSTNSTNTRTLPPPSTNSPPISFKDREKPQSVIKTSNISQYRPLTNFKLIHLVKEITKGNIKDPISLETFKSGETVYLCSKHQLAFHEDSWIDNGSKCHECGNDQFTKVHKLP